MIQENTGLAKKNKMYYADKSEWKCAEYFYYESVTDYKEEKQMKIEKTMLIGELIQMHDLIPQMLMGAGMHCLGCPASQAESLEEACMVHGIDCDTLVSQMNEILADK